MRRLFLVRYHLRLFAVLCVFCVILPLFAANERPLFMLGSDQRNNAKNAKNRKKAQKE